MSETPRSDEGAGPVNQAARLLDRITLGHGENRPNVLLMVATAVALALVVAWMAIGPALSHPAAVAHRPTRVAGVAAVTPGSSVSADPTSPAPTPAEGGQATPAPGPTGGSTTAAAAPTPATTTAAQSPRSTAAPTSLPAMFANSLLTGVGQGGFSETGSWSSQSTGGYPSYSGPSVWTTSTSAWTEYTLGSPSGGQHWEQVRVWAWIPNVNASAWVRYTITYSNSSGNQVTSVDLAEQVSPGWNQLGTFAIGSGATRSGSIWVSQTHLNSYSGSENWAAAQVKFEWN